ncbi:acyl-CoA synthetase (AMP-forming)/AMP-acid ligase II [Modestobacter roseus]|uniref:Acyl-CoA synthetase (AMP-forming)/AMP-acid ligase II n=1 Tax=Modestobacter roseus TaxID=1181884 RepID=A0A562IMX4_9ACTN|nr:acyl-CoA synthetase (AMP-forming)/AMP-acid ligase II [Modestobacter roseus]
MEPGEQQGLRSGPVGFAPLDERSVDDWLIDRIAEVALGQPEVPALADRDRAVSYADLLREAETVRAAVVAAEDDGRPVCVLRRPGVDAVVAVVGVIAAGTPVVVLDPTTPAPRLRHYVELAGARVCVSEPAHAEVAAEVCPVVVQPTGPAGDPELASVAAALGSAPRGPGEAVSLVFTSGSTGLPKGVFSDSRTLVHDAWTNSVASGCYGPGDVVANLLPLGFDAGLKGALAGLLAGTTQQLFDPRTRSVSELPGWLREVGASVLVASPAIMRGLVATLPPGDRLDTLSTVTMGGETVHAAQMAAIRGVVGPDCEIRNRYGSTETGLLAEFRLRPGDPAPAGAVPVGRPVPGMQFLVEMEDGERREHGTGRLVVTSHWLGRGYWGAPELTAAAFSDAADGARTFRTSDSARIDEDGYVTLLGRTDHSVKVRGHLVEPGEVDAALFALPEVREAVVVGAENARGQIRLVAYVVPAAERLDAATVRRAVRDVLPGFMVPQDIVFLTALPRTERGKLDRSALPPPPARTGTVPPGTDWERVVAAEFARALELEEVGLHDDFFELGGDSLAAEALLASMGTEMKVPARVLTTTLLQESPTVASFAEAVRRGRTPEHPTMVRLRGEGSRAPLFCVAGAGVWPSVSGRWPSGSGRTSRCGGCRPTAWRTAGCRTGRCRPSPAVTWSPCGPCSRTGPTGSPGTPWAGSSPWRWLISCGPRGRRSHC